VLAARNNNHLYFYLLLQAAYRRLKRGAEMLLYKLEGKIMIKIILRTTLTLLSLLSITLNAHNLTEAEVAAEAALLEELVRQTLESHVGCDNQLAAGRYIPERRQALYKMAAQALLASFICGSLYVLIATLYALDKRISQIESHQNFHIYTEQQGFWGDLAANAEHEKEVHQVAAAEAWWDVDHQPSHSHKFTWMGGREQQTTHPHPQGHKKGLPRHKK
jgi:hypothetical protein